MILDVMNLKKCLTNVFLLTLAMLTTASGGFVGVNIGTDVSDLPAASNVVAILKAHQITHVRLYDADTHLLQALSNTSIEVIVGVTNEEVLRIGESPSAAAAWINKNVLAYVPSTNITAIAVGSEVLSTIPNVAPVLVPAMNSLHKALVAANLNFRVKVSTPHSMDIIPKPFPPSTATFNSSWNSTMVQLLQFLKNTNSSFMLNAYPYYGYTKGDGIFPIEYALFKPLPSVKQIVDPNTLFHYNSMFDAMVDAAYYSIDALDFSDIPVVVTETGWPSSGGSNEPDATVGNAETYNNNLIRRVLNDSGPPSQVNMPISAYIYELFNEDKRNGPISEKNWGIFYSNGSAIYPLSLSTSGQINGTSASVFCVAKDGADSDKLQAGLNYACGQGGANCAAIQQGQPCYLPNNVKSHASFAFNDYYQKTHSTGGTCDFDGTATITTRDPSYGSCIYTGSSNSSGGGMSLAPTALGPSSPSEASSNMQMCSLQYLISVVGAFLALVML
ncbi:glucan endo-1,3-beta-glucosidase 4 [Arachis stenosperma]|uniref:glucan endo-1,3-beta-glucosidase 4 n=1 Tax=Arachis stenosperma TaxID=217475 RepID=UPI0025ABC8DC|nr:glucan endo-1,3-beta-glucosidase 4 [Arachis stenosperma]